MDQVAFHHSVFSYIIYLCICIHYTPRGVIYLYIYLSINLSFESLECELLPIYQSVYLKVLDEGCYLLINLLRGVIHVPICLLWKFWVGLFRSSMYDFAKCVYLMCSGACVCCCKCRRATELSGWAESEVSSMRRFTTSLFSSQSSHPKYAALSSDILVAVDSVHSVRGCEIYAYLQTHRFVFFFSFLDFYRLPACLKKLRHHPTTTKTNQMLNLCACYAHN